MSQVELATYWTPGQQRALTALDAWSRELPPRWAARWTPGDRIRDWKLFGLFGYAGTGKTTVIGEWLRGQRPQHVLCVAPTHKAVSVLQARLSASGIVSQLGCMTLHSALSIKPKVDPKTGEEFSEPGNWSKSPPPISRARIVVLDECSMVDSKMWEYVLQARMHYGFEMILMGDPCQLPPLNEAVSPTFDRCHTEVLLDEVVRHDGVLARTVAALRDSLGSERPFLAQDGSDDLGDVRNWYMAGPFLRSFCAALDAGVEARILAWRNDTVDYCNRYVRHHLYGERAELQEFVPGEVLVNVKTYGCPVTDELHFAEDELVVADVRETSHALYGIPCTRVEATDGRTFYTIGRRQRGGWRRKRDAIKADCKATGMWGHATAFRKAFATLRPAFATTIHKAQGSTWSSVYVVQGPIMAKDWGQRRYERDQLLYVAYSRAARGLHVRV